MIEIKKSIQPILTKPSDTKFKPVRKKTIPSQSQLEYEETLKRLQQKPKTPSNGAKEKPTVRKLYTHRSSFEEANLKENVDDFEIKVRQKPKNAQNNLKPTREILKRSVKNVNHTFH